MSIDFDEEFDLVKALRESQALEAVSENDDGTWTTKVVPDFLANKAADKINQLNQEIADLRKQVNDLRAQKSLD
jgi:phage shock protein A